jgi:hypothetical protein
LGVKIINEGERRGIEKYQIMLQLQSLTTTKLKIFKGKFIERYALSYLFTILVTPMHAKLIHVYI